MVMVLTGLISTLIIQGFGFATSLYSQVEKRKGKAITEALATRWFRDVNENLVASKNPGESLVGDPTGFTATTLMPLLSEPGVPMQIEWAIEYRIDSSVLIYRESGQQLETLTELDSLSVLQYKNRRGKWLDEWPIQDDDFELPVALRIFNPDISDYGLQTVNIEMRLAPDRIFGDSLE